MSFHNPHRRAAQAPLGLVLALPVLFAGGQAYADNWVIAPRVSAGYKYSDNYRLNQPGGEIEVSGGEFEVGATLHNVSPRTRFELTPRIYATYFPNQTEQQATDYYLDGVLEDHTQRRTIGINGDFAAEDVVRSELPSGQSQGDLGNPQNVDSGNTLQPNRRDFFRVSPYFSYDMSPRSRLELDARYLNANYEKHYPGSQEDFSEFGASAGIAYLFSPRTSLTFRALGGRYDTTFYTDSYGGDIEWERDFSETSRMYVRLGAQETRPENGERSTNSIGGIGGRFTSQRNVLFIDATRQVTPISAGTVVERYQLRVSIDHEVSQRIGLQIGARALRDEEIKGVGTYPTRKYAAVDAGFEWRIERWLSLLATYNYRWQEYADQPSDASANGFVIGLRYEPKRVN